MTTNSASYTDKLHNDMARPNPASPFTWLRKGWDNLTAAPATSLALGLVFTALCASLFLAVARLPMFTVSFLAAVLLVAPFIAAASYHVVKLRENGARPSLRACWMAIRSRFMNVALFSLLCTLLVAVWVRLTSIAFALAYGSGAVGAAEAAQIWTDGSMSPVMTGVLVVAGLVLAAALFVFSAITLPLISDRNMNAIRAAGTGLATMRQNVPVVLVWALLLAISISLALASGLLLMPVIFPLLAYATWYSYRDLYVSRSAGV